jgi:predicted GNAT family N-acyltransferase
MAQLDRGQAEDMNLTAKSGLRVSLAQTETEREAGFALRYRVFVEEMGCSLTTADPDRKLDRTAEDHDALHFCVWDGDELAGVLRLFHGARGVPAWFAEGSGAYYSVENLRATRRALRGDDGGILSVWQALRGKADLAQFITGFPLARIAVVSRLAIDSRYRGGAATVALFRESFRLVLEKYPETSLLFVLSLDNPRLLALYSMLGFQTLAPERAFDSDLGPIVPMYKKLRTW